MASQDISIVLDNDSIEIGRNKTQDLEFLIKTVWDDDLGIGQNVLVGLWNQTLRILNFSNFRQISLKKSKMTQISYQKKL